MASFLSFTAIACIATASALPCASEAQERIETSLVFLLGEQPSEQLEKSIYENLRGLDPACSIHFDAPTARLAFRSSSSFHASVFTEALISIPGIRILEVVDRTEHTDASDGVQLIPGFPAYQETGDEVGDDLRYQEAKRAWIATHPEEYRTTAHPQK